MELRKTALDLAVALKNVAELEELLPICSHCKSIRDDQGYWKRLESYFKEKSSLNFTHGVCPDCAKEHYGFDCEDVDKTLKQILQECEVPLPS